MKHLQPESRQCLAAWQDLYSWLHLQSLQNQILQITYVYMYVCIYVHMFECGYVYMYMCIYVYICVHICVHICTHICTHICVHICVHIYNRLDYILETK